MQFHLFGDETSQISLNGNIILVVVIQAALRQALVH